MFDDLKNSVDEFNRNRKAKNEAKGRTENDRQWAESVCERKINQLVCKVVRKDVPQNNKFNKKHTKLRHLIFRMFFID